MVAIRNHTHLIRRCEFRGGKNFSLESLSECPIEWILFSVDEEDFLGLINTTFEGLLGTIVETFPTCVRVEFTHAHGDGPIGLF